MGLNRRNHTRLRPLPAEPGDLTWTPFVLEGSPKSTHWVRTDDLEVFLRADGSTVAHGGRAERAVEADGEGSRVPDRVPEGGRRLAREGAPGAVGDGAGDHDRKALAALLENLLAGEDGGLLEGAILGFALEGLGLHPLERVEGHDERDVQFVLQSVTRESAQPIVGVDRVGLAEAAERRRRPIA